MHALHNADRDQYITKKFEVSVEGEKQVFDLGRPYRREYWEKKQAVRAPEIVSQKL